MASIIHFFAPLSAMRKRTRLAKMAQFLEDRGGGVKFYGWERDQGELERLRWKGEKIVERPILSGGGYAIRTARLMYPFWMLMVFIYTLMLPKNALVWCLGWETAFPARLAGFFRQVEIIFDDADRFSMLIRLPDPLHKMLIRLEQWTSRACHLHLVPGWTRYEWRHERMVLLRNSPLRADYEYALKTTPKNSDDVLTIYVNGWIAWDTGAKIVLRALDELKTRNIACKLIVAGRIASEEGKKLIERPEADFKGELPQREALALYRKCDVTLTLYDPSVTINHHAESNKWGDCVFLSTPFIVNSEVGTAHKFVEAGAALEFPYNNHKALADLLEKINSHPEILEATRQSLKDFTREYSPFENQLEEIFSLLACSKKATAPR